MSMVTSDLESSQEGGEDVDLDGLLPAALCLPHTLSEVREKLLPVLVGHCGERPAKQQDGRVDDGHAQWEGPRDCRALERWPRKDKIFQPTTPLFLPITYSLIHSSSPSHLTFIHKHAQWVMLQRSGAGCTVWLQLLLHTVLVRLLKPRSQQDAVVTVTHGAQERGSCVG